MADRSYEMYLEEIQMVPVCRNEELERLLPLAKQGDEAATERIVEGLQRFVLELAGKMGGKDISISDLIQECNVALLLTIREYEGGDFKAQLQDKAMELMRAAVEEQNIQKDIHEEVIARIRVLQKVSEVLTEELDREPTLAELANKMKMTEDEVQMIMEETIRAMSVNPDAEE